MKDVHFPLLLPVDNQDKKLRSIKRKKLLVKMGEKMVFYFNFVMINENE